MRGKKIFKFFLLHLVPGSTIEKNNKKNTGSTWYQIRGLPVLLKSFHDATVDINFVSVTVAVFYHSFLALPKFSWTIMVRNGTIGYAAKNRISSDSQLYYSCSFDFQAWKWTRFCRAFGPLVIYSMKIPDCPSFLNEPERFMTVNERFWPS